MRALTSTISSFKGSSMTTGDPIPYDDPKLILNCMAAEGYSRLPYRDHLGFLTIGHGQCIDERVSGAGISPAGAQALLVTHLNEEHLKLFSNPEYQWIASLAPARQRALMEMILQMGFHNFTHFRLMLQYLKGGLYEAAAAEMRDSRWAHQTPNRVKRLMQVIVSGAD